MLAGDEKFIEHDGELTTITKLAKLYQIPRTTVASRYYRGYRGKDLVHRGKCNKYMGIARNPITSTPLDMRVLTDWLRVPA